MTVHQIYTGVTVHKQISTKNNLEQRLERAGERKMIKTIEDTDYTFSTYIQVMEKLETANREKNHCGRMRGCEHGASCAEYYKEAISLSEALPKSAFEHRHIREEMKDLYRNAFNFFVRIGSVLSHPFDYGINPYYNALANDAEAAIKIAERAKEKLELMLCDEATLQGLRKKVKEARESSKTAHIKEAKTEDDRLFYSNYYEWKMRQK